jgi:hypothetical protein
MPITMNDLTISPNGVEMNQLLHEWEWLMCEPMRPILLTALGDVFAQGNSRAVYFLDANIGTIEQIAANGDEFQNRLRDVRFVTEKLLPARILELRKAGITLKPGEVYSHSHPMVLGGEDTDENVAPTHVSVHLSLYGQIHRQIKDLPEGTSISEFRLE